MKFFKKIATITMVALGALILAHTSAFAILTEEAPDNNVTDGQQLTSGSNNPCLVVVLFETSTKDALVSILYGEGEVATPNNVDYLNPGGLDDALGRVPLTKDLLENTCGLFDVTINETTANGTTFDNTSRYGFDFNYSLTSGGPSQNAKFFLIGDPPVNSGSTPGLSSQEQAAANANAMIARAKALANNQTDLSRLLKGNGDNSLNLSGNGNAGAINFDTDAKRPFWLRLNSSWSQNEGTKSQTGFAAFGSHYKVNDNLLFGAMVQFDRSNVETHNVQSQSTGFLIGPYLVARLPEHPLYFEGLALWGRTFNESNFNGQKDDYTTDRFFLKGKLSGDIYFQNFTLTPNLIASHVNDHQEAYSNSANQQIPSQTITLTHVTAGIDITIPIEVKKGKLDFKAGFDGVFDRTTSSLIDVDQLNAYNGTSARLKIGFDYLLSQNMLIELSGYYDGLGQDKQEGLGLQAAFNVKF